MGLAVFDGQLYPVWAGNFSGPNPVPDEESTENIPSSNGYLNSYLNNGVVTGFPLNIWYQPMVIASGPRIISSTMGPVVAATLTGSAADLPNSFPLLNTSERPRFPRWRSQGTPAWSQQPRDHALADLSHGWQFDPHADLPPPRRSRRSFSTRIPTTRARTSPTRPSPTRRPSRSRLVQRPTPGRSCRSSP